MKIAIPVAILLIGAAGFVVGQTTRPADNPPHLLQAAQVRLARDAAMREQRAWAGLILAAMESQIALDAEEAALNSLVDCRLSSAKCAWCGACLKMHKVGCVRAAYESRRAEQRRQEASLVEAWSGLVNPPRCGATP